MDTIKWVILNIVVALNIIKLNATDSTNTYLKLLVNETDVQDQTVVIAEDQQKGRGQMGNGWLSRKGQSLTFSVFKRFEGLMAEKQFMISMAVSLAIIEAFQAIKTPKVSIKWPNDILSGNKKVAGILIENVLEGASVKYSVIGIGINVNEVDFPELPQASSLKLEIGKSLELEEVLQIVLKKIFEKFENIETLDFSELRNIYEQNMFRKDSVSVFENKEGQHFNAIIKGVSDIGELLIETENASIGKFQLKELKLIY